MRRVGGAATPPSACRRRRRHFRPLPRRRDAPPATAATTLLRRTVLITFVAAFACAHSAAAQAFQTANHKKDLTNISLLTNTTTFDPITFVLPKNVPAVQNATETTREEISTPRSTSTSTTTLSPTPPVITELSTTEQALTSFSQIQKAKPSVKWKNLTVGYLTAIKGDFKERSGLAISGALTMALHEINSRNDLLPDVRLVLKWNDTRGDPVVATKAMTDMICSGVSAFFGPEGSCYVEAIVAQSANIPMISYHCSDYKASAVPTFARTEPPDTQVTKSVIALLRYYGWMKFSIVYEQPWNTVASSLEKEAKANNMTINVIKSVIDVHICCEHKMSCCQAGYWYQLVRETKNKTRIYVFLGSPLSLLDMMNVMQSSQLFDEGEYMVIYVDMYTYSIKEATKYLWRPEVFDKYTSCHAHQRDFEKRARSLLVVVSKEPDQGVYENFTRMVQEYNSKEPFNFTTPPFFHKKNFQKFITIYAAYLYDSVWLYARALHTLLTQQKKPLTDETIEEVSSNGTKIIETIISAGSYESIVGATMQLDRNGDSEGNFSVLALQPYNLTVKNFTCTHHMLAVGYFQKHRDNLEYKLLTPNAKIDWPGGIKPEDEPSCGFNNESCPKDDSYLNSIISACVLAVLLFCAGVITMSIYRKWKIEQEIEGLLWKIDPNDIHHYFGNDIVSSPSKLSLVSASVTSYESRCGGQVFAATGQYRGVVVRIKELKFSKKRDISRDVMKEMRLLRDIRHDNINSFIGACIEPMRILLVTDYCAKGSLYDIIENEDIKLDQMFIASLIHDLIRGMMYIHNSVLVCHGNLKSSNCVVTSRWMLQVTDFGLNELRHCAENDSIGEHQYYRNLFWKAPELLRDPNAPVKGTQKGDIYSFAIILYELIGRRGPFGQKAIEPKEIIELVKRELGENYEPFRPDLAQLTEIPGTPCCEEYVLSCIRDCWAENPEARPDFATIRTRLKKMKDGKHRNIMDQLMDMMVKYADNLEDLVEERTRLLIEEKMKTEDLLHRMLPEPVAQKLTRGDGIEPESFDQVTIYFSDIVGFTAMSAESTPLQVVNFLNDLYTLFDQIIKGYDVYKVETIGDAYMVVSGLPIRNGDTHAGEISSMALDLLSAVKKHTIAHRPNETLKLRIGVHTGPVVAGVVGLTMPRYCLFGDTVNTASRMESTGEALRIHISHQCKDALDKVGGYITEERGYVNLKGKGNVRTFWLVGATEKAVQRREVDLGQLPPLFCRPRLQRSPKLNNESRVASQQVGISRRHSSVPRQTFGDSSSTLHGSSPQPGVRNLKPPSNRLLPLRQPQQYSLTSSRASIDNSAFGSETSENQLGEEPNPKRGPRATVLSSIASSCDERSLANLNKTRSMDAIIDEIKFDVPSPPRRSSSLHESNCPNGAILNELPPEDEVSEAPDAPLLTEKTVNANIRKRQVTDAHSVSDQISKKWKSLETVQLGNEKADQVQMTGTGNEDGSSERKPHNTNSLKSWLVGLFNGNGLRASNTSLRKGVLAGYSDLQVERESIV